MVCLVASSRASKSRRNSLTVNAINPAGVGVVSRSTAVATARNAWASMARVVQEVLPYKTIDRHVRKVHASGHRDVIAEKCFAYATDWGGLSLILYGVTTLYFEAESEDSLRRIGYSNYAEGVVVPRSGCGGVFVLVGGEGSGRPRGIILALPGVVCLSDGAVFGPFRRRVPWSLYVTPSADEVSRSAGGVLCEYAQWLTRQRGLAPVTVNNYCWNVRQFLAALPQPVQVSVSLLDAGVVTAFMAAYCRDRNANSTKSMARSVRSFLRFVHATGRTSVGLWGAVPAAAGWHLASLPKAVPAADLERLLDVAKRWRFSATESPWVVRRLGLLDSDQGLVGPLCIVERGFELGGRDVAEVAVQAAGVVPIDPTEGSQFDVFDGFPRPGAGGPVDQLGLVVAIDRFRQSVIETVAYGADGRYGADLGESLAVADGGELRPGIGVACQARQRVSS